MPPPLRGLIFIVSTLGRAGALYGGAWRTQRCSPEVAAKLAGADFAAPGEPAVWIAVDRVPGDGERLMVPVANEAPITRGVPDAVGRLLPGRPLIDLLLLSCPPETAEGIEATGYCIDGLLLAWLDELNRGADARFEDLRARGDDRSASRALERRGFVPLDDDDDDDDGGGDGGDGGGDGDDERAVTHRARLPGSVFAYQVLSGRATSSDGEREAYAEILAGLRGQPPPVPDVAIE